ncbi:MAG: hypothetical protein LBR26_12125 [Prevotella sp.]|jgi:hypothetical protein|nr:hypothetical protein [Prevotella sp.]
MKKILLKSVFFAMLAFSLFSCSDDDKDDKDIILPFDFDISNTGFYVLNSGSKGANIPASLTYFDANKNNSQPVKEVFLNQNKIEPGYGGQDMLVYGSKMYITMTQSNCIYVTDKKGKLLKYNDGSDAIIKPLNSGGQPQQPRSVAAHSGNVYASTYDGDIVRIDTTAMTIDKKVATGGTYPEEVTVVNNKLYTVISDYMGTGAGKNVAVINLASFTREPDIAVTVNPTKITSDKNGNIYVISSGNYNDILPALQKIAAGTSTVTTIGTDVATNMEVAGDKLLLMKEVYDNVTKKSSTRLSYYDMKTDRIVDESFVESGKADLTNTYNITVDPATNNIYLATSDYKNEGSMHIFDGNGKYVNSFKTGGINPMGAYFITGVK